MPDHLYNCLLDVYSHPNVSSGKLFWMWPGPARCVEHLQGSYQNQHGLERAIHRWAYAEIWYKQCIYNNICIYIHIIHIHMYSTYIIFIHACLYIYIDIRFTYIESTRVCHLTMVGNRCQPISIWTVLLIETWRSILLWGKASASVPCWLILSQQGRQRVAHVSYTSLISM